MELLTEHCREAVLHPRYILGEIGLRVLFGRGKMPDDLTVEDS